MPDQSVDIMRSIAPGVPHAIIVAESKLRTAQLNGDANALDALISTDLLFTGPDGQLATKDADLAAHRSGAVRFREHEPEELHARPVGDRVVITSLRARLAVEVGGQLFRGTFRYTRVWAREGDGPWQVAGGHVAEVPTAAR